MKLKNLILQRYRNRVVHQFGGAKIVRYPNGQHELIGGTDTDRAAAFEWSSLFAHEIVFAHFHRAPVRPGRHAGLRPFTAIRFRDLLSTATPAAASGSFGE